MGKLCHITVVAPKTAVGTDHNGLLWAPEELKSPAWVPGAVVARYVLTKRDDFHSTLSAHLVSYHRYL